jgi:thiosulfate/3-mercaptopyruvate sulfurtransferase
MHPLMTVAELHQALASTEPPVLLDTRWQLGGPPGIDTYRAGHLPGARYVDLDRDLAAPPGAGGRHPLPEPDDFGAAMRERGVSTGSAVIVYDDGDGVPAARLWWLLRWCGHQNVRMLDGGYRAWQAAGHGTTTDEPPPATPGDFHPHPGAMPVVDATGAAALPRTGGVLIDVRAADRYRGDTEPIDPVAGHIPGAVNAPGTGTLTSTGHLRSPADLAAHYAALGITEATPVAAYCGSGVTAAREILALEIAGIPAALYPGSWSDWLTDPTRPVGTGPAPG